MARDRRLRKIPPINPNVMLSPGMMEKTVVCYQMLFELAAVHNPDSSSRGASGCKFAEELYSRLAEGLQRVGSILKSF